MMSTAHGEGHLAYIDPISLKDDSYRLGKKSDIFSLGVILWQISSGKIPCEGHTEIQEVITYRIEGSRDPSYPETPKEYIKLYTECWDEVPDMRPFCEEVYRRLKYYDELNNLSSLLNIEQNDTRFGEDDYHVLHQYENIFTDLNESLDIGPDNAATLSR